MRWGGRDKGDPLAEVSECYCVRNPTVWGGQETFCFLYTPQATFEVLSVGRASYLNGELGGLRSSQEGWNKSEHPNLSHEETLLSCTRTEGEGPDKKNLP